MGGVVDALFGGKTSKSSSTPIDMTPDEYKKLRSGFADQLTSITQSGGPEYTGPLTTPITNNEQDVLAQLRSQAGDRTGYLNDVIAGKYLPGQQGSNPFLQAAIEAAQRPTLAALNETLSRTLPGRFTAGGNFVQPHGSSAFDRAAAIATTGAAQTMGDIAGKLSYEGYDAERTRQNQAIQLSQGEVDSMIKNLQAQGLPRLIEQAGVENGMKMFQDRIGNLTELLKILAGITTPTIGNVQTAESHESKGIIPGLAGTVFLPPGAKT